MDCKVDFIEKKWLQRKYQLQNYFSSLEPKHTVVSSLGIKLKHSGYFAMIPSNFDIDTHLDQHPVTDYLFVRDNTGHIRSVTQDGSLSSSQYFDKDRLIYIIGLISSIPAKNKDSITENGYVPINSKLIRNAFKDYHPYLEYLIRTGVLCTDGQYIQGEKSKGYKFTERYENVSLVRYNYPAFQGEVKTIPSEVFSEEDGKFIPNTVISYPYLTYWYDTKGLHIDKQAAVNYAHTIMQDKFNKGREYWDINRDKSHGNFVKRKYPLTQYHAALYNINSIALGDYKVSIDTNVHRLHSVITNLQKIYRRFLNYNGAPLVNIDISNSQPYLLCLLLDPRFWDKNSDIPLNIGTLPQNVQDKFSEEQLEEIKTYVSLLDWNDSTLSEYIQKASHGQIYEYMIQIINHAQRVNLSRDDIKVMILTTLFSKNRYMPTYKRYFKMNFLPIYELIELTKKDDHTALSCLLQSIESEIILHRCCKRILEEGNQQVPIFTIHDSICTVMEYESFVKEIMIQELSDSIGYVPFIKIERWGEYTNEQDN